MITPKLFTPGPVDVFDEVLEALGQPVPHMSAPGWMDLYHETIALLKQLFQTQNDLFILAGPGSGALEAGLCSLFQAGEKVLVVRNGTFGDRLARILQLYHVQVISVEGEWGRAIEPERVAATLADHPDVAGVAVVGNETSTGARNPLAELARLAHDRGIPILADLISGMGGYDVPVDDWGLDIAVTSSNKALEMAPGLGILSVSERAWGLIDAKAESAIRGQYYNLSVWKEAQTRPDFPYPSTPPTTAIMGLRASLKRSLEQEGLAAHWARYAWAQQTVRRELAALGFPILVPEEEASYTITTVCKHPSMQSTDELKRYLLERHNILISNGLGKLAGETMRIGHMGRASIPAYMEPFLHGVAAFLRERGEG